MNARTFFELSSRSRRGATLDASATLDSPPRYLGGCQTPKQMARSYFRHCLQPVRIDRLLRVVARCAWLMTECTLAFCVYPIYLASQRGGSLSAARARWLQRVCRRALRLFHVNLSIRGPVPSGGLLACNHLSYLDILVLSATAPCIFISKCEVRRWPVFGWFASMSGTVYVARDKKSDVTRINREIRRLLDEGMLVVLFPEGTTTDGSTVLPFKSSLLESATQPSHSLSAACIGYELEEGSVGEEVCYWRDMTLVPHLVNLLGKRRIGARLCFTRMQSAGVDRKQLARDLRAEVLRLKESTPARSNP